MKKNRSECFLSIGTHNRDVQLSSVIVIILLLPIRLIEPNPQERVSCGHVVGGCSAS